MSERCRARLTMYDPSHPLFKQSLEEVEAKKTVIGTFIALETARQKEKTELICLITEKAETLQA